MKVAFLEPFLNFIREENTVSFFQDKKDSGFFNARRNLKFSFILLIVWMIFSFVAEGYFFESFEELRSLLLLAFFIFASICALFIAIDFIKYIYSNLKRRVLPLEFSLLIALALTVVVALIPLFQDHTKDLSLGNFIVLLFLIAFDREISLSFKRDLQKVAGAESVFTSLEVDRIKIAPVEKKKDDPQLELDLGSGERSIEKTEVANLKDGDSFQISQGEIIPIDCIVKSGSGIVRSQNYGFWGCFRVACPRIRLSAGGILLSGSLTCEATDSVNKSEYRSMLAKLSSVQLANNKGCVSHSLLFNTILILAVIVVSVLWCCIKKNLAGFELLQQVATIDLTILLIAISLRALTLYPLCRSVVLAINFLRGIFVNSLSSFKKLVNIKKVVLDFSSNDVMGSRQVVDFRLIDSRIDQESLASVLLSLFNRPDNPIFHGVIDYLAKQYPQVAIYDVSDFRLYREQGLVGKVEGAQFYVGRESFLIERGVHLQTSDSDGAKFANSDFIYVALGTELIAKIEISPLFLEDGKALKQAMEKSGIAIELAGGNPSSDMLIYTGLSALREKTPNSVDKILSNGEQVKIHDWMCCLAPETDLTKWQATYGIVTKFLPIEKEDAVDAFYLNRDVMSIYRLIQSAKNFCRIIKLSRKLSIAVAISLLVLACFGIISPIVCGSIALLGSIVEYFLLSKIKA